MDDNPLVLQAAEAFAREHLRECAAELLELSDTSILKPNGRVRELALLIQAFGKIGSLRLAETIIQRAALEAIVKND